IGTREGWFTGKKLSDYLGGGKADWKGARRIINGQDRAAEIALHAQAFAAALKKAGYAPGTLVMKIPVPPVTVEPAPPLVKPAPRNSGSPALPPSVPTVQTGGVGAWLKSLFSKKAA
ncbi:hypothetical protein KZZ08_23320, partial [Roseovarius mucosus]|nr:hypothetical protein [Roseovarius mucosus]